MVPRWVRSEWTDVRPPDRLLRTIPASGVPPRQALCAGRLHSTRSGDRWSYAGWGCQGDAVRPQRGETVLSSGMQVHPPADQLLSPLGGSDRQTETWKGCEIDLPTHVRTEPQGCVLAARLHVLSPPHTHTPPLPPQIPTRVCPGPSEGQKAGLILYKRGKQLESPCRHEQRHTVVMRSVAAPLHLPALNPRCIKMQYYTVLVVLKCRGDWVIHFCLAILFFFFSKSGILTVFLKFSFILCVPALACKT